jgi:beta-lactamase superfamily II metal-dependent hydrolase
MPKDALEVHFLNVGDADCILVTRWECDKAWRLLIDGGDRGTVDKVKGKLKELDATDLDAVLCSHLDDDHAAGLVEIVADDDFTIGRGFMHVVEWHLSLNEVKKNVKAAGIKEEELITASVGSNSALLRAFASRGIKPVEPFEGVEIDGFLVCGPEKSYYESLMRKFTEAAELKGMDALIEGALMEKTASAEEKPLLANPTETPANNSITLLTFDWRKYRLLFTADAGVTAQRRATAFAEKNGRSLKGLSWMQIPHHGSRSAINKEQITYFSPQTAYVSVSGEKKPAPAVVEGFKACGSKVFCTCGSELRWSLGDVPDRGLKPASAL